GSWYRYDASTLSESECHHHSRCRNLPRCRGFADDRATMSRDPQWPDLPLSAWSETCDTLHLWTQIVGKMRIATTPLINHWWNATLFVTARGLAAPAMRH